MSRSHHRSRQRAAVLTLAIALVVAACGRSDDASDAPVAPVTPAPSPVEPPAETGPVSPFTGLPIDAELLDRPLLVTTVENSAAARPQAGLDAADVVLEKLVEGGLTRFMVLFHSDLPDVAGPVRSARPVDVDLLSGLGPSGFAFSGARDEVLRMLETTPAVRVVEGVPGFLRDPARRAPHNLYIEPEVIRDLVEERGARPLEDIGWVFDEAVPEDALTCPVDADGCTDPGVSVVVEMSPTFRTGWTYDAPAGVYRRDQNGRPFATVGPREIGAANVVILATRHYMTKYPETDGTTQGAPAIVLRDGRRYEARWEKPDASDLLLLLTPDGDPFPLRPGPTWLHLPSADRMPEVG